jgi:hypothetical protein
MLKEDTINVFVNIGNDVKLKNKVATDEEGFAVKEPLGTSDSFSNDEKLTEPQPMPDTNVPEEERIIDDGDPVVQTVIEMCKKYGIGRTVESLQRIAEKKTATKYTRVKAKAIADELLKIKKKKNKKNVAAK